MSLRLRICLPLLALLACSVLCGPGVALAQPSDGEKAYWQDRYRTVLASFDSAKAAHEAAELRYREGRRADRRGSGSNRTRGEEREAVRDAVPQTAERLAAATQALEEFPEVARRAGVPPGWLREVDDARADALLNAKRDAPTDVHSAREEFGETEGHMPNEEFGVEAPADTP